MLRERRGERMGRGAASANSTAGHRMPKGSPEIKGRRRVDMAGDNECRTNA